MKDKSNINTNTLRILCSSKDYVSGEELSETFGISRAAIHKRMNCLRDTGYDIESVTKKGYRLLSYPDIVDGELLFSLLQTECMGQNIISFGELDSTNEYAKKVAAENPEGTVIIADCQTKGKGRRGRSFHSEKGEGLFLSVILKPNISPEKAPFLTGLGGAALLCALDDHGIKAKIKWPNDILINGKKISGILTEMSADMEKVEYIVLGIGINVNNKAFPEEIKDIASSLKLLGYSLTRQKLFAGLMLHLERLYKQFLSGNKSDILQILTEKSCILGKKIIIHKPDGIQLAKALELDEDGALIVNIEGEGKQTLHSGEVSIRENRK